MHISAKTFSTATALSTLFMAQVAQADIAPQDVWDAWKSQMTSFGYEVTSTDSTKGDMLTARDVEMTFQMPEDSGVMTMNIKTIAFAGKDDGSVAVNMSEEWPLHINGDDGSEQVVADILVSSIGMQILATGTKDEITYTYGGESFAMDLVKMVIDGEQLPDLNIGLKASGLSGVTKTTSGDTISSTQVANAETMEVHIKGSDVDSGTKFDFNVVGKGLALDGTGDMPVGDFTDNPAAFFAAGFGVAGTYSIASSEMTINVEEDGTPTIINTSAGPSTVTMDMNDSLMSYDGSLKDVAINIATPDIPLPIDVSFGEYGFGLQMPLKADDSTQDAKLKVTIRDLAISEMLWGMFDPGQVLPRDPATLLVDLAAKVTVFTDLMTLDETVEEAPGELNAVTLNNLQLDVAGASLSGKGAFVFDNTDTVSFDGMPRPEGKMDINIAGVNGLMDKLISMGLLPEQQAMGARMMMSMFTVPGDAEDTLSSEIVINAEGHVSANGQRIK